MWRVPDQPTDVSDGHSPRTDWRLGGRTVARWRERLLGVALVSYGIAIVAAALLGAVWESPWAAAVAVIVVWAGMLVPVGWAFRRSRPAGLLRFRWLDLLYATVLGMLLRVVQGWVQQGSGGSRALPSYPLVDDRLPLQWWITDGLGAIVVAPVVEEFFFRAVLLVATYTLLRRRIGRFAAAVVALLATTAVFVLAHTLTSPQAVDGVVAVSALGITCGLLVLLTGRIWGAVLTHAVFNATWVALALAGTYAT